ncbi:MAG: hypothetical protein ACEQSB_00100 [Undibacterium sp.]
MSKAPFQKRVCGWMIACFGGPATLNRANRANRFLEETLELYQAVGGSRENARELTKYVYDRKIGEPSQEAGGVLLTLAGLCSACGINMDEAGETELARVWGKTEQIRAKEAAKPTFGPLPGISL